jgi:hypothetical protein
MNDDGTLKRDSIILCLNRDSTRGAYIGTGAVGISSMGTIRLLARDSIFFVMQTINGYYIEAWTIAVYIACKLDSNPHFLLWNFFLSDHCV